jgi:hypothetical protein
MASSSLPNFLHINDARRRKHELLAMLKPFEVEVIDLLAHGGSAFGGKGPNAALMTAEDIRKSADRRRKRAKPTVVSEGASLRALVRQGWLRFAPGPAGDDFGYFHLPEAARRLWDVLWR